MEKAVTVSQINNYLWTQAVDIGEYIEKHHRLKGDVIIKFIFQEKGKERICEGVYITDDPSVEHERTV